jgi:hypothetical protein
VSTVFEKTSLRFLFLESQIYPQTKLSKEPIIRIMNSDEMIRMLTEEVIPYLKGIYDKFVVGTE